MAEGIYIFFSPFVGGAHALPRQHAGVLNEVVSKLSGRNTAHCARPFRVGDHVLAEGTYELPLYVPLVHGT